MKLRDKAVTLVALMMIALLAVTITKVAAQDQFKVESIRLTLYRDGLVHVTQTLVVDELAPEIAMPLLSSSIENIIVLDENQTLVDYEVNGDKMTILTLGAKSISIEYDTLALTKKEAEVWTLVVTTPYNLTVSLPQNATLIYLSEMPAAIDIGGTRIVLSLHPGRWEISYVLPVLPEAENKSKDASLTAIPIEYLILAIIAVTAAALSAVLIIIRRRGPNVEKILKANPQLKQEDKEVIEFLAEKGGKAFEAEIRERFPDMPRTSLWRLVRRLERLEIVEIRRIGLENQVELKK
ncbi:MAG: hypothetical protein QW744_07205 [Candidatus Bathyarchaeia archaeon]